MRSESAERVTLCKMSGFNCARILQLISVLTFNAQCVKRLRVNRSVHIIIMDFFYLINLLKSKYFFEKEYFCRKSIILIKILIKIILQL